MKRELISDKEDTMFCPTCESVIYVEDDIAQAFIDEDTDFEVSCPQCRNTAYCELDIEIDKGE